MRLFIAIEIPEEIKEEIGNIQESLKEKDLFEGKMTFEENIHLTLKFLGDVESRDIEEIKKHLEEVKFDSFEAEINGAGLFSEKLIRILWLKLNGAEKLQKEIDLSLIDLFDLEKRFMSHVTFARVKKIKNKKQLIEEINNIKPVLKFKVNSFYLMESKLTTNGPEYNIIKRFDSNDFD